MRYLGVNSTYKAKRNKIQLPSLKKSKSHYLNQYGLIKNGKPTFAAYLLFVNGIPPMTAFQISRLKSEIDIR